MKNTTKYTTPKGTAMYPWLNTPDTKFNPAGDYKVNILLSKADASDLIKLVDTAIDTKYTEVSGENKNKKIKRSDPPYAVEMDDEGNETGNVIFKLKQKAELITRTGETIKMSVKLFDSQGAPFGDETIWGGSKIKAAGFLLPYYSPTIGVGVAMRLSACQVIELVTGGGNVADSFGFGKEEGGHVAVAPAIVTAKEIETDEENQNQTESFDDF